jgi:hypothetical protein
MLNAMSAEQIKRALRMTIFLAASHRRAGGAAVI